jgi:hypothetical protein
MADVVRHNTGVAAANVPPSAEPDTYFDPAGHP